MAGKAGDIFIDPVPHYLTGTEEVGIGVTKGIEERDANGEIIDHF